MWILDDFGTYFLHAAISDWYPAPVTNQWHSLHRPRSEGTFLPAWRYPFSNAKLCKVSKKKVGKGCEKLQIGDIFMTFMTPKEKRFYNDRMILRTFFRSSTTSAIRKACQGSQRIHGVREGGTAVGPRQQWWGVVVVFPNSFRDFHPVFDGTIEAVRPSMTWV